MTDKPCADCPWLRRNQTPAAVAANPIDGRGRHWFEKSNLLRHWQAASRIGAMLPCHKTDANAPLYGGRRTRGGHEHICVGLTVLAKREIDAFMNAGQLACRYRELPGKRFLMTGLAAWASRLLYAGAMFNLGGRSFRMPTVADDPDVGVPWKDSVHDGREAKP